MKPIEKQKIINLIRYEGIGKERKAIIQTDEIESLVNELYEPSDSKTDIETAVMNAIKQKFGFYYDLESFEPPILFGRFIFKKATVFCAPTYNENE